MMSAVRIAHLVFILIGVGVSCSTARSIDPVFSDLSEIFGDVCGYPLGVDIEDDQFSASSHMAGYEPYMARFNNGLAGWRAGVNNNTDQWIQVCLPSMIAVTAVLTQGSPDYDYYVTEYKVEYSVDGEHWFCLLDMHGQSKIFEGNIDNSTPKINDVRLAIPTHYIRIQPVTWHGALSMRLEIFGVVFSDLSEIFGVCGYPLGVDIEDDQFSASSHMAGNEPYMARFNNGLAGWRAGVNNNTDQWIQVRLPSMIAVTAVLTQGSPYYDYYVTEYKVEHSVDGEHWLCLLDMHGQSKIFEGNIDNSTPKINDFRPAIPTRYIRIQPVTWHGALSMRLEIFGGGCPECWEQ